MKILLFAHSGSPGGAESALRRFVLILRKRHQIQIVLPSVDSSEGRFYKSLGIRCYELKLAMALPHLPEALLAFQRINWEQVTSVLIAEKFDVLVSNTITTLHDSFLSSRLKLPHVTYVHEILEDAELLPSGLGRQRYLSCIAKASAGLIGCSMASLSQFEDLQSQPHICVEPFDYAASPLPRQENLMAEKVLQVIGTQSYRKNVIFATTVAKALKILGMSVHLDFIGTKNNASAKLEQVLRKRGVSYRVLPFQDDPLAINIDKQVITLVGARSEPYGLTIPESLQRGIPVVSSRSGGPSEMLSNEWLYEVDDLDGCVRILRDIWSNYDSACDVARLNYRSIQHNSERANVEDRVERFLCEVQNKDACLSWPFEPVLNLTGSVSRPPIELDQIIKNISLVAAKFGSDVSAEDLKAQVENEVAHPGAAVQADVRRFNVVPFAMSSEMDRLYAEGLGLSIELAATFNGPERKIMTAHIGCHLWNEFGACSDTAFVLALGDGVGVDSIRLANAGFSVDYMDYDGSRMAEIAALNFDLVNRSLGASKRLRVVSKVERLYDAVVCLEVIEHVPDPEKFIEMISDCLKPNGIVYISDCFNGLEDRWPTHLSTNERYAGLLPLLMFTRFKLDTLNRRPLAKPFVFRKRDERDVPSVNELLIQREAWFDLIRQQLNIGI